MNIDSKKFYSLSFRAEQLREEILSQCGIPEARLADAAEELTCSYGMWCDRYEGPQLPDPVAGFQQMIHDWPLPWVYMDGSGLNGLSLSQFYLVFAYSFIDPALATLNGRRYGKVGGPKDVAGCCALFAMKALVMAEHLKGTPQDRLAQSIKRPRPKQRGRRELTKVPKSAHPA